MVNELNESFLDQYKKLEKLCNDLLDTDIHGIGSYIGTMEQYLSSDLHDIPGWQNDLNRLKEIRHKRNVLVHESDYEVDINEYDVEWLREFRHRILEEDDPLALLEKRQKIIVKQSYPDNFMDFQLEEHSKMKESEKWIVKNEREEVSSSLGSRFDSFREKSPKEKIELLVVGVVALFIVVGLIFYAFSK